MFINAVYSVVVQGRQLFFNIKPVNVVYNALRIEGKYFIIDILAGNLSQSLKYNRSDFWCDFITAENLRLSARCHRSKLL